MGIAALRKLKSSRPSTRIRIRITIRARPRVSTRSTNTLTRLFRGNHRPLRLADGFSFVGVKATFQKLWLVENCFGFSALDILNQAWYDLWSCGDGAASVITIWMSQAGPDRELKMSGQPTSRPTLCSARKTQNRTLRKAWGTRPAKRLKFKSSLPDQSSPSKEFFTTNTDPKQTQSPAFADGTPIFSTKLPLPSGRSVSNPDTLPASFRLKWITIAIPLV